MYYYLITDTLYIKSKLQLSFDTTGRSFTKDVVLKMLNNPNWSMPLPYFRIDASRIIMSWTD